MGKIKFKSGELVVFIGKDHKGEIYTVEIGKIKRTCEDGAFVYYHTGDTAAKTNYSDLYKLKNSYVIDKESLGSNGIENIDIDNEQHIPRID